jgi:hypothetical protein
MTDYREFIDNKSQLSGNYGFEPVFMPDKLFDFQQHLVEWSCRKGRSAIFADCGLGKTFMQLSWAQNVAQKTNGRVLILTPLAVSFQTVKEGEKIGVEVSHRREGIKDSDKIVVTNYERLNRFSRNDFVGCICDESSILKSFDGVTRAEVTEFMRLMPYRLLCTATAAPNDFIELGTSSEAIGDIGATDMISRFFKKCQQTTSAKDERSNGFYRLRPHAEKDFWRWICSWSRAIRKPSDIGFSDNGFHLPRLITRQHTVKSDRPMDGFLFDLPAVGLKEQRSDLRRTIEERCSMACELANSHKGQSILWCNLNQEGDTMQRMLNDSVQVSGNDSEEHKEDAFTSFINGTVRHLITKPSIAGFGLNLQCCNHQTFFPSHSYEQFYQAIRRCWRFGQKNDVTVDMITTDGQADVLANLNRKAQNAESMFQNLVCMMQNELMIKKVNDYTQKEEIPSWL